MGNIVALDMGIVVLRVSIFDKDNKLFPFRIQKRLREQNVKEKLYFMNDLSFYSKEHAGTFHFLQFNILHTKEFMESQQFLHLLEYLDTKHGIQKEMAKNFLETLELRKDILDMKKSSELAEQELVRDYQDCPIMSTGGYNDHFLKFIAHLFNSKIVKCRDFMHFVVNALDYLNRSTNDCFFKLQGTLLDSLAECGKLKTPNKPRQQFFSLKEELYPYLLVNIRNGTTFTRVDSKDSFHRVVGTSIGSSTFWGILRLMGFFSDPTEAILSALKGDSSNVDMSVGDIYGGSYPSIGLKESMIASSFGRLKDLTSEEIANVNKQDISRSLITMIAVNILIFSNMIAKIEKLTRVVWIGIHIDVLEYMQMSEAAFDYITKSEAQLMYPTYHSFLGSLGLLLSHGHLY